MGAKSYRDLIVWQKSLQMVKQIYELTRSFPKEELYGLTSQIRRGAVSIPANIAEGFGRRATGDNKRFLNIAMGSLFELETLLLIASETSYLSEPDHRAIAGHIDEVEAMLASLIRKLRM